MGSPPTSRLRALAPLIKYGGRTSDTEVAFSVVSEPRTLLWRPRDPGSAGRGRLIIERPDFPAAGQYIYDVSYDALVAVVRPHADARTSEVRSAAVPANTSPRLKPFIWRERPVYNEVGVAVDSQVSGCDEGSGPGGLEARIAADANAGEISVIGLALPPPPSDGAADGARLYLNDIGNDADGDGVGSQLERRLCNDLGVPMGSCDHWSAGGGLPNQDADQDGLTDGEEVFGRPVFPADLPEGADDGLGAFPRYGVNPYHKDLVLEMRLAAYDTCSPTKPCNAWYAPDCRPVNATESRCVPHLPPPAADDGIQPMVEAFATQFTAGESGNPDGLPGISAHVDTVDPCLNAGNPLAYCGQWGGAEIAVDYAAGDCNPLRVATNPCSVPPQGLDPGVRTQPQIYWESLSPTRQDRVWPVLLKLGVGGNVHGLVSEGGGTLYHELGHALTLNHGGGTDAIEDSRSASFVNCKPNYLSVMNYGGDSPYFSHGDALPINPAAVTERSSFYPQGGDPARRLPWKNLLSGGHPFRGSFRLCVGNNNPGAAIDDCSCMLAKPATSSTAQVDGAPGKATLCGAAADPYSPDGVIDWNRDGLIEESGVAVQTLLNPAPFGYETVDCEGGRGSPHGRAQIWLESTFLGSTAPSLVNFRRPGENSESLYLLVGAKAEVGGGLWVRRYNPQIFAEPCEVKDVNAVGARDHPQASCGWEPKPAEPIRMFTTVSGAVEAFSLVDDPTPREVNPKRSVTPREITDQT